MAQDEFQTAIDEVLARSNARRRATIERFVQVLRHMQANGARMFSVSAVGKVCETQKIITTQAIRNATGVDYRRLIEAFARSIGAATTYSAPVKVTSLEEAIAGIADKDVRTRLRYLLAEVKSLRNENNTLAAAFKRLSFDGHPPSSERELALPSTPVNPSEIKIHPPAQFDVVPLAEFVSERWIDRKGWLIDQYGTIRDENDDRLTPNGFVPALRAAVERLKRPSS